MLTIEGLLAPEDVARVREGLSEVPWRDGKRTAGHAARKVKSNSQADSDHPKAAALDAFVRQALERNALLMAYARPTRWSLTTFNRYRQGEAYGLHVDDALMGQVGQRLRTDLSFTLFLSDADSYDGGELILDTVEGEMAAKLPAGSIAVYPTGELHRVAPVTRGERLAAVGWIQSAVRRADERALLFDLTRARGGLADGEPRLLIDKAIGNLLRLWAEP